MENNTVTISTDKSLLDFEVIFSFLSSSYWGKNYTKEMVKKTIEHSLCFGLYLEGSQIGFARVITDYTRFAYLADVFVLPEKQGRGYGKYLLDGILNHDSVKGIGKWMLATSDAHGLYKKFGFTELKEPDKYMERKQTN